MDAIHNIEHENTILVKSLTVATERIEKFERHIKSENLIFVEIQSQSFDEAASQPPGKMFLPTQILKLIKTLKRRFSCMLSWRRSLPAAFALVLAFLVVLVV